MNWFEPLDEYCERISTGLLNEPLNFFSNASFFVAAILFLSQCRNQKISSRETNILGGLVLVVGVGSSLFHSFAERWAKMADVIPIGIFILVYIYIFIGDVLRWNPFQIALSYLGFFLLTGLCLIAFDPVVWNGSHPYFATFLSTFLLAGVATKKNFLAGKNLRRSGTAFGVALVFRTIDSRVCPDFPVGTHFMWHIFNGMTIYFALRAYISPRLNPA